MRGEIRAVEPGPFQGGARIYIGKRVVVRKAIGGKLRTRWSRLRVSLPAEARRRVVNAAHRAHRRPILEIGVKYNLEGQKHFRTRARRFIVTLPR